MARIAHLADVHWRGLSRHAEFRDVFQRFFDDVKSQNVDIIYIGGDIVHSKTQGISPEVIDCLTWWFREMSKIAPVHLILGNHDGIITNLDRQDAISPIITALGDDNIKLFKPSGVFPTGIPGFNWCNFSCFDEEGWSAVKPVPGEINIALFHGPVWGSRTDIDWEIDGSIDVDFFSGYDFTFLGDIHKQQFLTPDKRIAYCGSTIQQDYGEVPEKGYLLWDIRSKDDFDVEFRKIEGKHPFITVDWMGSTSETLAKNIPSDARIRIATNKRISPVEWKHFCNELNLTASPVEIVMKDSTQEDVSVIKTDSSVIMKDNIRDPDVMVRFVESYLKNSNATPQEVEGAKKLARDYISTISKTDEFTRGSHWSIRRLEFDNSYSYDAGNVIDFSKLDGITGIFGRNAVGKSSIIGTMMYGLFNTTDRGPIKNLHVINTRKDHCLSKITVMIDGELIRLERQSVKVPDRNGNPVAVTHLNVMKVDSNGEIIEDQSYEQRRVTEQYVRNRIGTADDFLLTSLASQGEMNSFIRHKNTQRKMILTRFLGLDIFEAMSDVARDESKSIQAELKRMTDRDWDTLVAKAQREITKITERMTVLDADISILRNQELELSKRLNSITDVNIVTQDDVDACENEISVMVTSLNGLIRQRESNVSEIEKKKEKMISIVDFKSTFAIDDLKKKQEDALRIEKLLTSTKHEHDRAKTLLTAQERSVMKLKEVPCGDSFPSCKFIKDSHVDRKLIDEQRNLTHEILVKISQVQEEFDKLLMEKVGDKLKKYEIILEKEKTLSSEIKHAELAVKSLGLDIDSCEKELAKKRVELETMSRNVVSESLGDDVARVKKSISTVSSKIKSIDSERLSIAGKKGTLENEITNLQREKEKYKELMERWRIYDLFMQSTSKRGIPLQIIMSQLPAINAEIAKILQGVVSFTVELEADPDSNEMDVFINYGDSRRIIEVASGMEKMIASLAIRVALISVSSLPKTDTLFIDEGFGALDDVNIEACNRLLVSLKHWFRSIVIITHVDGVKDIVENVIDITWNGHDAHVFCD